MANNRMNLVCQECAEEYPYPASWKIARFALVKYYPSTGWYINQDDETTFGPALNTWLNSHQHGTACGNDIRLEKDVDGQE